MKRVPGTFSTWGRKRVFPSEMSIFLDLSEKCEKKTWEFLTLFEHASKSFQHVSNFFEQHEKFFKHLKKFCNMLKTFLNIDENFLHNSITFIRVAQNFRNSSSAHVHSLNELTVEEIFPGGPARQQPWPTSFACTKAVKT